MCENLTNSLKKTVVANLIQNLNNMTKFSFLWNIGMRCIIAAIHNDLLNLFNKIHTLLKSGSLKSHS